jgi:Xaa-Pro aminopeptidase
MIQQGVPDLVTYILSEVPCKSIVGFDPHLHSAISISNMSKNFLSKDISLIATPENPIDLVRGSKFEPKPPYQAVRVHPIEHSGETVEDKIRQIRNYLLHSPLFPLTEKLGEDAEGGDERGLVLSVLEEVMWVLNLRGRDFECNQVTVAYALVTTSKHTPPSFQSIIIVDDTTHR